MKNKSLIPVFQAILASILFGISAPLSKLLLADVEPIPLTAFLYLGSGLGAAIAILAQRAFHQRTQMEAKLSKTDIPWLIGAVFVGGILAPIALLFGLEVTAASTASLLLNFESAATAILAALFFHEAVGKRVVLSIVMVTAASILLTWTGKAWGFSGEALLILLASLLWGLDNNLTRHISAKDPLSVVIIKGLSAGSFSLVIVLIFGFSLPSFTSAILAMVLGIFSYGMSIYLIILALRSMGSARTYGLFASAPFVGMLVSLLLFPGKPQWSFWLALLIMIFGTWLMLSEGHHHLHEHFPFSHDHSHDHMDAHHSHSSEIGPAMNKGKHTHLHVHEHLIHDHPHQPDIHHRHLHTMKEEEHE